MDSQIEQCHCIKPSMARYLAQAILLEVCTSPKPGLVTRKNNGAHGDMSIITFAISSPILFELFYNLEKIGKNFSGEVEDLLSAIRPYGVVAESQLFSSTKNINTQKGILFSGGILSAAAGFCSQRSKHVSIEEIVDIVKKMTNGLVEHELTHIKNTPKTAGEELFQKFGIKGIRGEVEEGFPRVMQVALPALKEALSRRASINDSLVHTLISLMSVTTDTNILWRSKNMELATIVQGYAQEILKRDSIFTLDGRNYISYLEAFCIENNISPGGCADLLSITVGLYLYENGNFPGKIK